MCSQYLFICKAIAFHFLFAFFHLKIESRFLQGFFSKNCLFQLFCLLIDYLETNIEVLVFLFPCYHLIVETEIPITSQKFQFQLKSLFLDDYPRKTWLVRSMQDFVYLPQNQPLSRDWQKICALLLPVFYMRFIFICSNTLYR